MSSKNVNLVNNKVGKAEVNDDGNDEEVLDLEADKGKMLNCIVLKILLVLKFEKDNQWNKFFRTRSTINGKICNVIISSGNSKNIFSKMLVHVMELSTEKYLAPYKIW